MGKTIHKTVDYADVPARMKKKFRKRYEQLRKKHPELSEGEIQAKIEKKMNIKFDFEK